MVGHGGSSAGSYIVDPTSPIPSHCASIVVTSTLRVNGEAYCTKLLNTVHDFCVRDRFRFPFVLVCKSCGLSKSINESILWHVYECSASI